MTGVEWADKYFYLPEGSSHIAGHWTTQPVGSDAQYDDERRDKNRVCSQISSSRLYKNTRRGAALFR